MKGLLLIVLIVGFVKIGVSSEQDSVYEEDNLGLQGGGASSEIEITPDGSVHKEPIDQKEKSIKEQAEEIPVVFGQWWFWVGLFAVILFLKFVIFKK